MQWVVGTGRCGLHNYVALKNGYIVTDPYFRKQVVLRFQSKDFDTDHVIKTIEERNSMDTPCIADESQFLFIDYIRELDNKANFVWLIRNKDDCVKSFTQRVGEDERIHPSGWDFKEVRKKELIEWYYDMVNRLIKQKLYGADYKQIRTEDMKRVVDKNGVRLESSNTST